MIFYFFLCCHRDISCFFLCSFFKPLSQVLSSLCAANVLQMSSVQEDTIMKHADSSVIEEIAEGNEEDDDDDDEGARGENAVERDEEDEDEEDGGEVAGSAKAELTLSSLILHNMGISASTTPTH
jgi:hypothetical protein